MYVSIWRMVNRRAQKILNILITLCLVGFVMIFMKGTSLPREPEMNSFPAFEEAKWMQIEVNDSRLRSQPLPDQYDLSGWTFLANKSGHLTGSEIVKSVNYLNENFNILNLDRFGPVESVRTVIIIQVHNRITYLGYLIESLRSAKGVEDTLLVFSHDINVPTINEMIRNITFARVYQIFYPYNMQLFPAVFPGRSPNDCDEKIKKEEALKSGCVNAEFPDKYGHYRVAQLTQIKHHWWWKMNYVFDGIIERFGLNHAWVLLLEEDHFVAPDALHVLNYITENREKMCSVCELVSLGFYLKNYARYGNDIAKLGAHPWYSSKHNMGMAMRLDTWNKIKNCSEMFCSWDDYNWDWSLMQISVKCVKERFRVIFPRSPRVLHIGDCGVHTHRCDAHDAYGNAKDLMAKHKDLLFPNHLSVTDVSRRSLKPSKENGGWGDSRDHELCRLNSRPLDKNVQLQDVLRPLMQSSLDTNANHTPKAERQI